MMTTPNAALGRRLERCRQRLNRIVHTRVGKRKFDNAPLSSTADNKAWELGVLVPADTMRHEKKKEPSPRTAGKKASDFDLWVPADKTHPRKKTASLSRSNEKKALDFDVIVPALKRRPVGFQDLPQELVRTVLEFVGPGQYRCVAGTCKEFRYLYEEVLFPGDKSTSIGNSADCVKLYLGDSNEMRVKRLRAGRACLSAAKYGRVDILQSLLEGKYEIYPCFRTPRGWRRELPAALGEGGDIDCYDYFVSRHSNIGDYFNNIVICGAAAAGRLSFLQHIHNLNIPFTFEHFDAAVMGHQRKCCVYIRDCNGTFNFAQYRLMF